MAKKNLERPQFVTCIAVITFIIGVAGIILAFTFSNRWQEFIIASLGVVTAIGLLRMKQWSIWLYAISLVIGVISTVIFAMTNSWQNTLVLMTMCLSISILIVRIYFFSYIYSRKNLFTEGK